MLSSWGVAFDPIDVPGNPQAQAELERLGVPRVPATVVGGRAVHGWNPQALADLVGVPFTYIPTLSPAELAESLDRILAFGQHGLAQAPGDAMGVMKGGRKRTLRELGYHMLRIGAAFVDAMEQSRYPLDWITDYGPESIASGPQLAAYGEDVRARVRAWFAAAPADAFERTISTYYGDQTAHELLERTTWHSGQHLRQVYDMLAERGVVARDSLDDSLFEGLPLPERIW